MIIKQLLDRVKIVQPQVQNFPKATQLIDDLMEACLYFSHVAETFDEECKQWRDGTRTQETVKAEKAAWDEFEESIKKSYRGQDGPAFID